MTFFSNISFLQTNSNKDILGNTDIVNIAVPSAPAAPKDALEALEQRRAKYVEASAQAKASGDDRKARMHDRIAKVQDDTLLLVSCREIRT